MNAGAVLGGGNDELFSWNHDRGLILLCMCNLRDKTQISSHNVLKNENTNFDSIESKLNVCVMNLATHHFVLTSGTTSVS